MVELVYYLSHLFFCGIPLLYYYINLRRSIIFCLFSGERYIYLGISSTCSMFSVSFWTVSGLLCGEVLETCNFISSFITNDIINYFQFFSVGHLEAVFNMSAEDCLAWSRRFWLHLPLKFLFKFITVFLLIFLPKYKHS